MDKGTYLEVFDENREAILAAAEMGLEPRVKGCPDWDVGALVAHVGSVYTFWSKWIRRRPEPPSEGSRSELMAERNDLLPGYVEWSHGGFDSNSRPAGLIEFCRSTGDVLAEQLRELGPEEPVWTFYPPDQTAGFIQRRIAHETTIHRWDAEESHSMEQPISRMLAADGIDEYLNMAVAHTADGTNGMVDEPPGKRVQFHPTDGFQDWHVDIRSVSRQVSQGRKPADVEIIGSTSDILLFLWGRRNAREMEVTGDADLVDKWGDLAGRF